MSHVSHPGAKGSGSIHSSASSHCALSQLLQARREGARCLLRPSFQSGAVRTTPDCSRMPHAHLCSCSQMYHTFVWLLVGRGFIRSKFLWFQGEVHLSFIRMKSSPEYSSLFNFCLKHTPVFSCLSWSEYHKSYVIHVLRKVNFTFKCTALVIMKMIMCFFNSPGLLLSAFEGDRKLDQEVVGPHTPTRLRLPIFSY